MQSKIVFHGMVMFVLRLRIPDVRGRHPKDLVPAGRSNKFTYTIWAVFGGFILHFLLSNYLTVLLRPRYEEPVETASDLIKRNITPVYVPMGKIIVKIFAGSPDPNYKEISRRIVVAKDLEEYEDLVSKVTSTGKFAVLGDVPDPSVPAEEYNNWYRSTEAVVGLYPPYNFHLTNKKWPLKKVILIICINEYNLYVTFLEI